MNGMLKWWRNQGVQAKFQILVQAFLFALLLASQQWISHQFEELVLNAAEERARVLADGAINGLNTLMVTKIGSEDVISDDKARALFIEKMGAAESVREMRIIRGKGVIDEFDEGLPQERAVDDLDRSVLASGRTEYRMNWNANGTSTLRAVVPFVARENFRGIQCLKCHGVDEGAVLGAASITVDVSNDVAIIKKANLWIWISLGAIQIILFLVIGFITRRAITGPLRTMRDGIAAIERHKDFTQRLPSLGGDEIGQTATTFNVMVEGVQGALKRVHGAVAGLRAAADSVDGALGRVVTGSSEQSGSSAAMAAAIEEMTVSISHVSSSADDALTICRNSNEVSELGERIIDQTVTGMHQISSAVSGASAAVEALGEQSRQITSVVQVIKDVADQTNLLALNAAIEAARAGESGRGFAVVADEVRKLAERTSNSTMEIAGMVAGIQTRTADAVREIQAVVAKVAEGQNLAAQAGEKIAEIRTHSGNVATSFGNITEALREENLTSQDIARNVEKIASIADDNHAIAQSMVANVEHLNGIAREVDAAVSIFKV